MHDLYGNTNLTDSNFSSENIEASGKRHTIFQVVKEKNYETKLILYLVQLPFKNKRGIKTFSGKEN